LGSALLTFLGGAVGAAIVGGIFSLIQHRLTRKDKLADLEAERKEIQQEQVDIEQKALRYIMLYIIQERAKSHIRDKEISLDDRRSLHHWHDLYHNGLGGNGDADALMAQVDRLPVRIDE
jgi:hypothetical protein